LRDSSNSNLEVVIALPIFNDVDALNRLLEQLDHELVGQPFNTRIVIIDDGSTESTELSSSATNVKNIWRIDRVRLRRNLGHQRAIAVGLGHIHEYMPCDMVVLMDADGEDRPEDVPRLVQKSRECGDIIVFAERTRRSESISFRILYQAYKVLHWLLTGIRVRVGNFSVIPKNELQRLVVVSELWNHYAAAVFNAKAPYTVLSTTRGERHSGRSKMNFIDLMIHGLSAISVFSATVGVRLLVVSFLIFTATLTAAVLAGIPFLATGTAVPLWAAQSVSLLLVFLMQLGLLAFGLVVFVLNNRDRLSFLPIRDYKYFIQSVDRLVQRNE
jgi:glycosyltransferase involved in cell wall biosynthesis